MGPDVLRRIRWGNVARVAGALAVIAAVAAWPRLAPPEPALPGNVARPLDGLGPMPSATPPAELLGPRPPRMVRRPGLRARRSPVEPRRGKPEGEVRPADRRRATARRRGRRRASARPAPAGQRAAPPEGRPAEPAPAARNGDGRRRDTPSGGGDPAQTEFGFERG